jgi:SHS2 domain-containing protein
MKKTEPYIFLEHTADVMFQASGRNLEEAFSNAALAMISLIWDIKRVRPKKRLPVKIEGRDEKQLLMGFLEEVLYFWEVRSFLTGRFEEIKITPCGRTGFTLSGFFAGEECGNGPSVHGEVKAVTYSDMMIEPTADGFLIQVVLDI